MERLIKCFAFCMCPTCLQWCTLFSCGKEKHRSNTEAHEEGHQLLDVFDRVASKREKFCYSSFRRCTNSDDGTDWLLTDQLWPTLGEWNINNLYSHVHHSVQQGIKLEPSELDDKTMFNHLQLVFHIDNDRHKKLLENDTKDEDLGLDASEKVLNLEIVKGKGFVGKDGVINPFCTSYIHETQKHNTCMKQETQNPIWREYFSFPVVNCQDDVLTVEVWNYDPYNILSEKIEEYAEMKRNQSSLRGMKQEWTNLSDNKTHDFLGCLKIPLKNIKVDEGLSKWYPLESRSGYTDMKKGEIQIRLGLCTKKEKKVASQEYRHLLHLLLVHELEEEEIPFYQWEGKFGKYAECILKQFQKQENLTQMDIDLAKWMVFNRIQCVRPLNAELFIPIVTRLTQNLQDATISQYEIERFWLATEKFTDSFLNLVKVSPNISATTDTLIDAQIVFMLQSLSSMKNSLETEVGSEFTMENIQSAIEERAHKFFQEITQRYLNSTESPVEDMSQFSKVAKSIVQDWDNHLKLRKESSAKKSYNDDLNITLKLYTTLKEFAKLSSGLDSLDNLFVEGSFHNWFNNCVTECLEAKCKTALDEITTVVDKDTLETVDDVVKFSDSAIRMAAIFKDAELFWTGLSLPEIEGAYRFYVKLIDNVCKYVKFYVESMVNKIYSLERLKDLKDEGYEVSEKFCVAINDIEEIGKELSQITEKLGTASIWDELTDKNSKDDTANREKKILAIIEKTSQKVNVQIIETLQKVALKMRPVINKFLHKGLKSDHEDNIMLSELVTYLDKNLCQLKEKLASNVLFEKFLYILWGNISVVLLSETKKQGLNKTSEVLQSLKHLFDSEWAADVEVLQNSNICEIEDLIKNNNEKCYTTDRILKYYQERVERQSRIIQAGKDVAFLKVTTLYFKDDTKLVVEILSANNLKPADPNVQCKPYVTMKIILKDTSDMCEKYKTKKQKGTAVIFDQVFSIKLTPSQMKKNGMMVFSVKDSNTSPMKKDHLIGECILSLNDVYGALETKTDKKTYSVPLTVPINVDLNSLQALLADRPWDKIATKFVKSEQSKISKVMKR